MSLTERVNLLLDADMRADLDIAADRQYLTVNQWVRAAIREKLERDAPPPPHGDPGQLYVRGVQL